MNDISQSCSLALNRLRLFLALSRTPHGLLDLATPALAALLWLGAFPPLHIAALGLITAFAGYTSVYALNDVVDFKKDREQMRLQQGNGQESGSYLDEILVHHPMAQGLLSYKEGLFWTIAWAALALIGAYLLNPMCAFIFLAGCALEAIYCLLLDKSQLRTFVSGMVKTSGGVAAVFAVDADPSLYLLILLFLWLFFWEIGGQNVPADWYDLEEDQRIGAQTIPLQFGLRGAGLIVLGSLTLSCVLGPALARMAPARLDFPFLLMGLAAGAYLLLFPAYRLFETKAPAQASTLFNRASYYPFAMFMIITLSLIVK